MKNVVRLSGFSTGRAIRIVRKPNVFAEKIIESVLTIRFVAEWLMSLQRSVQPLRNSFGVLLQRPLEQWLLPTFIQIFGVPDGII